jgi:hypothetical protein
METWRDIEGYEGSYQVSDLGRVRSLDRKSANGHKLKGMARKLTVDKDGYHVVGLTRDRVMKHLKVHRLVAQAFIPNPDNKPEVNHINGFKTDNRASELEWCTTQGNTAHAIDSGLHDPIGASNGNAKLTEDDVQHIRWLAAEGVKQSALAREWAVTQTNIRYIVSGRTWSHV